MDSANGFCLPRKCPLLIIKKQKNMFSFCFITSSLLSNSRRKRGLPRHGLEPAGERWSRDQTLFCISSPRANGPPQQLPYPFAPFETENPPRISNLPPELHYQTGSLARSLSNACYIWRWWEESWGLVDRKGVCVWEEAPLAQLPAIHWVVLEKTDTTEVGHPRLLGPSWRNPCIVELIRRSCIECASYPKAYSAELQDRGLWTQLTGNWPSGGLSAKQAASSPFPRTTSSLVILLLVSHSRGQAGKEEEPYITASV